MAIKDEIHEQTVKLKNMSFKEKRAYIWEYYKWWIIGVIAAVLIIISIAKSVVTNSRPVYLTVYFLNTILSYPDTQATIEEDFINAQDIDTDNYNLYIDYSMYIDDDYGNQNSYTTQVRLMAQYSARTIDIVCGPVSAIAGPACPGGYSDIEEILPEGMIDELREKGYEPFYYTEITDDETADEIVLDMLVQKNAGGELDDETKAKLESLPTKTYIAGIYIDNCDYLNSQGEYGFYAQGAEDRPVLVIAPGTQNIDHVVEFINFITK